MLIRVSLSIDQQAVLERIQRMLSGMDVLISIIPAESFSSAMMARKNTDLIILSLSVMSGLKPDEITILRKHADKPEMIVIVDTEDADERAQLIAMGVFAVVFSGITDKSLERVLRTLVLRRAEGMRHAIEVQKVKKKNSLSDFVSSSPVMNTFMDVVRRIVDTDATLLILGETGVGKEHLARAIHMESRRSRAAFVALNCGALPENLLESELFGHEEGAFTGATKSMRGQFEMAHKGTIFLDEIAEMPTPLQVKLLHVLEQRQIRRLGGERLIPIDVRIMAATNRNLSEEIAQKRFRLDLYYRLSALTLNIPPLRERREDIPELVENYLGYFCAMTSKFGLSMDTAVVEALVRYDWPGNVRELINVIERATLLCTGNVIRLQDLPVEISRVQQLHPAVSRSLGEANSDLFDRLIHMPIKSARDTLLAEFDRNYLTALLTRTHGRVGEAARRAGISPRTLYDTMKHLGISKNHFRQ